MNEYGIIIRPTVENQIVFSYIISAQLLNKCGWFIWTTSLWGNTETANIISKLGLMHF